MHLYPPITRKRRCAIFWTNPHPLRSWPFSKFSCWRFDFFPRKFAACLKPPSRDNYRKASYPRTQQRDQGAGWTHDPAIRVVVKTTPLPIRPRCRLFLTKQVPEEVFYFNLRNLYHHATCCHKEESKMLEHGGMVGLEVEQCILSCHFLSNLTEFLISLALKTYFVEQNRSRIEISIVFNCACLRHLWQICKISTSDYSKTIVKEKNVILGFRGLCAANCLPRLLCARTFKIQRWNFFVSKKCFQTIFFAKNSIRKKQTNLVFKIWHTGLMLTRKVFFQKKICKKIFCFKW